MERLAGARVSAGSKLIVGAVEGKEKFARIRGVCLNLANKSMQVVYLTSRFVYVL